LHGYLQGGDEEMAKNQAQHIMDLYAQENLLILEELQVYQDDEYAKGARTSIRLKRLIEREKDLLKELRTRERLMSSGVIWLEGEPGLVSKGASVLIPS
jgi:hypothetical protein